MSLESDLKNKKVIFGIDRTLKEVKNHKIKKVYIASNSQRREYTASVCKSFGVEVEVVKETNKDLGIFCKKSFSISAIGIE